jgi:LacI family transcriptional regulator
LKKKVTIYNIAKELGITVSTVSRALSGFTAVNEDTRKAVIAMAKKLNYTPNRLASALKLGRTNIVGVIVPRIQAHFFSSVINNIEKSLKASGYRVVLAQSNELLADEINAVKTLIEAQVDGVIASISMETENGNHFEELLKSEKPVILFDRVLGELNVPTVTIDDFRAGYLATQHLIDRNYKRIAFVTTEYNIHAFSERLRGYKSALTENGLEINPRHILPSGLSIRNGRFAAAKLMRENNRPDAILAGDDFTALGIIKKLKELGLTPPQIGVIGFANESFSDFITPTLSTINQHPDHIGTACAEMFLQMVKRKSPLSTITHVIIKPTLMARESTNSI